MSKTTMAKALIFNLINGNHINKFLDVSQDWFNEIKDTDDVASEKDLYSFIKQHYDNYSVLPDFSVFVNYGVDIENDVRNSNHNLQPVDYYINYFRDRYLKTKATGAVQDISSLIKNNFNGNPERYEEILTSLLDEIKSSKKDEELTTLASEIEDYLNSYDKNKYNGDIAGVKTGFYGLDEATDGIKPGDIFVIAARPNVGKTYVLLKMALEAWKAGKTVLVVSLEMEMQQIVNRLIAIYTRLKPDLVAQNRLSYYGERILQQKSVELVNTADNFYLLEGNLKKSVNDVLDICEKINPDVVFIDGVYLLEPITMKKKYDNRREKISDVLESIKSVAMETGKGFVVTTQFNRQVKKKTKSELDLSNIAETDVIGQLASVVMGVKMGVPPYSDSRRIIEVIKNRNGPLVKFEMQYDFKSMDFSYIGIYNDESAIDKLKNKSNDTEANDVSWMY